MEKLICSNDYISGLDEELGQAYKEALIRYVDKKDVIVRQQRNWIKWDLDKDGVPDLIIQESNYQTQLYFSR